LCRRRGRPAAGDDRVAVGHRVARQGGHVRHAAAQLPGVAGLAVGVRHAGVVEVADALLVGRGADERAGVAPRELPGALACTPGGLVAVAVEHRAADAGGERGVRRVGGQRDALVEQAVGARVGDRARRAVVARGGEEVAALHHGLLQQLGGGRLRGLADRLADGQRIGVVVAVDGVEQRVVEDRIEDSTGCSRSYPRSCRWRGRGRRRRAARADRARRRRRAGRR
jgi:hypothetical protein